MDTKTVLFIANNGEPRIEAMQKLLPEYGWQTKWFGLSTEPDFVYELGHNELDIFRRYLRPLARLGYRAFREISDYPRFSIGKISFAYWLKDVSVIVASGPPFDTFVIAKELSQRHHIPWIGDYRDLWTQNHNYPYTPLRRVIERRLEKSTVSTARALSTVSTNWVQRLGMVAGNKVRWMIPNGFNPYDYQERIFSNRKDFSKLRITYAGRIYKKQRLDQLLTAIAWLGDDIELHYYGPTPEHFEGKCAGVNVFIHEPVHHEDLMQFLRSSDMLWLMNFPKEDGWMSLKIYTYLAARRPILITDSGPNDCKRKLLEETHAGTACSDMLNVMQALLESYSDWRKFGMVPYHGVPSMVSLHSHRQTARQMSRILNQVVNK